MLRSHSGGLDQDLNAVTPDPATPNARPLRARLQDTWSACPLLRGFVAWAAVFAILACINWDHRRLPYYWDSLGYVYPHAMEIHDANLFPFLRHWDVGHPTAFFVTLAAAMKLLGVGPLVGHLLVWMFTALLVVAVYGLARVLDLPKPVSVATALLLLLYPVVWAMNLQILIDLPLLAVTVAAYWFWARDRRTGYIVLASYGILMKLHGVILIAGPLMAAVVTNGRFWRGGRRGAFLKDLAWAGAPLVALGAFLVARYVVRGPGLTVDWVSGNRPIPIWHLRSFLAYAPTAYYSLYQVALVDILLYVTVGVLAALSVARGIRRRRATVPAPLCPSRGSRRLLWLLVFSSLANNLLFFQSQSLCARYILPTVATLFLLLTWGLWHLLRRSAALVALCAIGGMVFLVLWHPKYADRLPAPLSRWLRRPPVVGQWRYENDLRFLDVVHQMQWAAKKVQIDAGESGIPARIATQWPMTMAYAVPELGYVKQPVPTRQVSSWEDVDPEQFPYVVFLWPVTLFHGPPPSDRFEWRNVAVRKRQEITAEIWHVKRKSAADAATPER